MIHAKSFGRLNTLLGGIFLLCFNGLVAQVVKPINVINKVDITINTPDYQMAYLADFIDVRAQKLSPTISGVSIDIDVVDPAGGTGDLFVEAEVLVQLQGDASSDVLVRGRTNKFKVPGHRTLFSRDFANESTTQDIKVLHDDFYYENTKLRKRLEDLAQTTVTVPPGMYKVVLRAKNAVGNVVGTAEKTVVISQSNVEETIVEVIEPTQGGVLSTLTPTFVWTTTANEVIVRVYEVGQGHRSMQDAVSAAHPCLVRKVTGTTTLIYPADAERKLEYEKAYVVQVSALVTTNRGVVERPSKPILFRITNDRIGGILDKFFSSQPSDAASTYTQLRSEPSNWVPWQSYGVMMLDGKIITAEDLDALLTSLSQQQGTNISISIENR